LGTMAGRLLLWDLLSGKILRVFRGHRSCIEASFELSGSHLSKSYVFQQLFQTWWILRVFPRKVWDTWVPTTCCSRRMMMMSFLIIQNISSYRHHHYYYDYYYYYYYYYYILLLLLMIIVIIVIIIYYYYNYVS
jgi:hypothetical protein